jgi:hypothetical protein
VKRALILSLLLSGCATAERSAVTGQAADIGSTGIALAMGATEANPLGAVALGVKAVVYNYIKAEPPIQQPHLWGIYGAFGWGAAANNLCIIGVIASGGAFAAICPVIGFAAGFGNWEAGKADRDRETFDAICAQETALNPDLVCVY